MPRLRRAVSLVCAGVAVVVSTGCGGGANGGAPPERIPEVGVVTIAPQRAVLMAELPGRTLPFAVSDVRPQVNGILKARLFTEGSLVEAGQPLYQIDDALYRAAYESASAQLANARAALTTAKLRAERYEELRRRALISQQDYDEAQATLEQARADVQEEEANVQSARVSLGYTRIVAPITGKISRSFLTEGALVTANQAQALATIQTLDPIYVDMNQSSSELLALRRAIAEGRLTGDAGSATVTLTLDDGARYPHEGTLQVREVTVDATTGAVTLRAQFPNPDGVLLPGMFVRANIVEGVEENALLVPQRGVSRDDKGNATALVVDDDGVVQLRRLDVSRTVGERWLVKGGIAAGERVIVEGLQYARPGQKANAVPFDAASPEAAAAAPAPAS
jgi:membrane fusion protein (multidrug efflux system)